MKEYDLKDAFGATPERIRACVAKALSTEERKAPVMKRKMSIALIAAAIMILLIIGGALAASHSGLLAEWLGFYNRETGQIEADDALSQAIQYFDLSHEGDYMTCTVTEAIYDPNGGTYSLGWRYAPKREGETLYVVCNGPLFDGEWTEGIMGMNDIECLLTGAMNCAKTGKLPESGRTVATLSFNVYRVTGEIEHRNTDSFYKSGMSDEEVEKAFEEWFRGITAEGRLNLEGDGVLTPIWWDGSYDGPEEESLVRAGLIERVDQFELTIDIGATELKALKTIARPVSFTFGDGSALSVTECTVTPLRVSIAADYITDERPVPEDSGDYVFISVESFFENSSFACVSDMGEPYQTDNGRWTTPCTIQASPVRSVPDSLTLTLTRYKDGEAQPIGTALIELSEVSD